MRHWHNLDRTQRKAAIITLRDAGKSKSEIAATLHVGVNSLHGFAFRQEIPGVSNGPARTGGWYDLTVDEKIAEMRRLTQVEGKTGSEVAAALGLTLGAVYRFNHAHREIGVSSQQISLKPKQPEAPEVTDRRPVRADAWVPVGEPVGFMANTGCCWPVDGGYCGHAKAKKSYCAVHHAMAYPPTRTMSEESIKWLSAEDARAENRRNRVVVPVARPTKREAVRYDDE